MVVHSVLGHMKEATEELAKLPSIEKTEIGHLGEEVSGIEKTSSLTLQRSLVGWVIYFYIKLRYCGYIAASH